MIEQPQEGRARSDSAEIAFRKIFIGGLSYSTDEEKLKKYFKNYGVVQDAVVMKDPVSKRSRGFGFITFYDISSVDNVLAHEPHTIDSRKVEAKRAVPRSEINRENAAAAQKLAAIPPPPGTPGSSNRTANTTPTSSPQISSEKSFGSTPSTPPSIYDSKSATDPKINSEEYAYNKIFVGGLHYDTRDPEFRSYFEKYGKVVSAEVMFNRETHKSRGFGFIVYELEESAIKVCAEKEHVIDGKAVEVKRAIPRSKIGTPGGTTPTSATSSLSSGSGSGMSNNNSSAVGINSAASNTGSNNVRSDMRRTMSAGSAQAILNHLPLSGNSSTLVASAVGQQKLNASPAISNSNKKSISSSNLQQPQPTPTTMTVGGKTVTSYAAALKSGGGGDGIIGESTSFNLMGHNHSLQGSQMDDTLNSMYPPLGSSLDMVRPNRAQSEPIVSKGAFDLPGFNLSPTSPPTQNNNGLAGGMSWLAVATSMPTFEQQQHQQQLNNAQFNAQMNQMNNNSKNQLLAGFNGFHHHNNLAAAQQYAALQQQQQQAAFAHHNSSALTGHHHGLLSGDGNNSQNSLFGSPPRINNPTPASHSPGVPSPEAWSSLIAGLGNSASQSGSNINNTQQPATTSSVSASSLNSGGSNNVGGGYYTLLNDTATYGGSADPFTGTFQSFSDTALFVEGSNTYRQRSASRDENGSLILGITQQARNSRSNSEVDFLVPSSQNSLHQRKLSHDFLENTGLSDLRLDSSSGLGSSHDSIWR